MTRNQLFLERGTVGSNPTLSSRFSDRPGEGAGGRVGATYYGEVAERLKAHAWKACEGNPFRGFESHPLRHYSPPGKRLEASVTLDPIGVIYLGGATSLGAIAYQNIAPTASGGAGKIRIRNGSLVGPRATWPCEPRQIRKEAAVAVVLVCCEITQQFCL